MVAFPESQDVCELVRTHLHCLLTAEVRSKVYFIFPNEFYFSSSYWKKQAKVTLRARNCFSQLLSPGLRVLFLLTERLLHFFVLVHPQLSWLKITFFPHCTCDKLIISDYKNMQMYSTIDKSYHPYCQHPQMHIMSDRCTCCGSRQHLQTWTW